MFSSRRLHLAGSAVPVLSRFVESASLTSKLQRVADSTGSQGRGTSGGYRGVETLDIDTQEEHDELLAAFRAAAETLDAQDIRVGGPITRELARLDKQGGLGLAQSTASSDLGARGTLLLVTTAHPSLHEHSLNGELHPNLGRLIQPRHTSSIEATAAAGIPWAADNDCFQSLDEAAYTRMLDRIAGLPGCLFVTVPDVVGDAGATLQLFDRWVGELETRSLPAALVAQDGLEDRVDEIQWDRIAALFIGGSTEWKESEAAAELAREAARRGKWVHWGRVNTKRRFDLIVASGAASSFDGSKFARFRKTYLDQGLTWAYSTKKEEAVAATPIDWQHIPGWLVKLLKSDDLGAIEYAARNCSTRYFIRLLSERADQLKKEEAVSPTYRFNVDADATDETDAAIVAEVLVGAVRDERNNPAEPVEVSFAELLRADRERKEAKLAELRALAAELSVLEHYDRSRRFAGHDYGVGQRHAELNRRERKIEELERSLGADPLEKSCLTDDELLAAWNRIGPSRIARITREAYRLDTPATRRTLQTWQRLESYYTGRSQS